MKNLFSQLTTDIYVLTDNAIQTQFLLKSYTEYQKAQNKKGWVNPNFMPLSAWLQKQWHALLDAGFELPLLLSEHQQNRFWQQAIARHYEEGIDISPLVPLAKTAYHTAASWKLPLNPENFSEQNQAWLAWRETYLQSCRSKNLNDEDQWFEHINALLASLDAQAFQKLIFPKKLFLYGFFQFSPAQEQFFQTLESKGIAIEKLENFIFKANKQSYHLECKDTAEEIESMMQWAEHRLQQGDKNIACFVPNLAELSMQIRRRIKNEKNFYLHTQEFFSNIPLIYSALWLLRLLKYQQPLEAWSYLLRSPLVGGFSAEMSARARVVEKLYEKNEFYFTRQQVLIEAVLCPDWVARLNQLPKVKKQLVPAEWVTVFNEVLNIMGWPGEGALSTYEQQVLQSWQDLLIEFSRLETFSAKLSLPQALYDLNQLAVNWRFQSQENKNAPIQFFPLRQAYGLQFDAIWVMGMQESNFPVAPKPNVILPIKLQKQLHLPHSSPEWELAYAQALFDHLQHAAAQLVFSYAQQNKEGELLPSAFLNTIPIATPQQLNIYLSSPQPQKKFEYYIDEQGSPYLEQEIKGGNVALKAQSLCAFRGFAQHRLRAVPLAELQYGLTPRERGILLHKALEQIWQQLKNYENLINSTEEKLKELIKAKVSRALFSVLHQRPRLFNSAIATLEQERLTKLIMRWLQEEKKREPFSVAALEKTVEVYFSDLKFTLRVDRIDKISDQSYYIIDYKTGQPSIQDWLDERPNDPQLPFYALTSELSITGLVFAQVRADKMGFKGIAIESAIKGIKAIPTWTEQVQEWHKALNDLTMQIKQGHAALNPKEGIKTCETCDLQALCRVYEDVKET